MEEEVVVDGEVKQQQKRQQVREGDEDRWEGRGVMEK